MIDLSTPNEWQFIDPATGLIFPWYTKPALDEIAKWDLSEKIVFEYGCGASSLWWAAKCKRLCAVESNKDYYLEVYNKIGRKAGIAFEQAPNHYATAPREHMLDFDIVIIDGILREECVTIAIDVLKPGGILIFDNWMQPSVEVQSEEIRQMVLSLPYKIYKQTDPPHPDWQTLIAWKPL